MLLSYYPPAKIVRKLQTKETAPFNVCPGFYRLSGNKLHLTLDSEGEECRQIRNKFLRRDENTERKTTYNMVWLILLINIIKNR